jgi:phosphoribosylamine--glycine ligase
VRVLVIGSGAREHALCLALRADPGVSAVLCGPGNAGTRYAATNVDLDPTDVDATARFAARVADLCVVGPEAPLVAGLADGLRAAGVACFGPSKEAARLEGSKAYAKEVMAAAGVPTAESLVCRDDAEVAAALAALGPPYVVKDDGLAAGKGVLVTDDADAARAHAARCGRVVVERYLDGPEVSLFVVTDGRTALPLLPAQDFKRIGDGDTGPNTGGMGAYCPLPWAPAGLVDELMARVVEPTLAQMRERGTPYAGLLYVGLALTSSGPAVIEFNCRFGDPETQVVLPLLATPLGGLLHAAAVGELAEHPPLRWRDGAAVTVVVAAEGYPGKPRTGDVLTGGDTPGVLHAGTTLDEDRTVRSSGGRVVACTATGPDVAAARDAAYALVGKVELAGSQHRSDVAKAAGVAGVAGVAGT